MKGKKYEMKFMGQEGLCAKKEAVHFVQRLRAHRVHRCCAWLESGWAIIQAD